MHAPAYVARAKGWALNASQDLSCQRPQHPLEVGWHEANVLGFSRGLELVRIPLDVIAVIEA